MEVLCVGGPLDGQRNVVAGGSSRLVVPVRDDAARVVRLEEISPYQPHYSTETYHVANGIARHESLSEAEVAARLSALYGKPDEELRSSLMVIADQMMEVGGDWAEHAKVVRKAAQAVPNANPQAVWNAMTEVIDRAGWGQMTVDAPLLDIEYSDPAPSMHDWRRRELERVIARDTRAPLLPTTP